MRFGYDATVTNLCQISLDALLLIRVGRGARKMADLKLADVKVTY